MRKSFLLFVVFYLSASFALDKNEPLHQLFSDYSSYEKDLKPRVDHSDKAMTRGGFTRITAEAYQERLDNYRSFLQRAAKFETDNLSTEDQVNLAMFQFQLTSAIDEIEHESYLFPMYGDTGFYFDLLRLGEVTELNNEKDIVFYVEQLESIADYLEVWRRNLETALEKKKVMPAIVLVDFEKPLYKLMSDLEDGNPLWLPLTKLEKLTTPEQVKSYQNRARLAINQSVKPAVESFIEFLLERYIPAGRDNIAIEKINGGKAYYRSQIKYYSTLNLSADAIHDIGLREVKRIRKEMQAVIKASGFDGGFDEFIEFLRTDPQFYAKTPEELLKEASFIAKKMDGQLPRFFTRLPRQPYAVEPVPDSIAPRYTTGRYVGAPLDSKRPGAYWVNTYALDKRPLYVLEALTLHEAVPGHHLQSALTKELDNLPEFRRNSYLSAYGEGWALYCEKLGIEAGFYQDPYSQFGRLSYEMWRAIRLVVDTGMHAKDWSRAKAIEFMESNTALSKHNVKTEIDRYIAWPGQALSYKLGELKILELREKAEKALGLKFDLRKFHDEILSYGPVTLPILEQQIDRWIASTRNSES